MKKNNYEITLNNLKEQKNKVDLIIKEIESNKEWGFDTPWEFFILGISFLNAQSYGSRIQNRFIKHFNFKKVKSKDNNGDLINNQNQSFEFKASILTQTNTYLNLVQLRPWQDVSYYCFAFDIRNQQFKGYLFELTKQEMIDEMKKIKATSAHGTQYALKDNLNIEFRMSLKISNEELDNSNSHINRWISKYLIQDFDFNSCIPFEKNIKP